MNIPQRVLERMARDCHNGCGVSCGDRPCDACMAGGVCDRFPCHCDDEPSGIDDDSDEDAPPAPPNTEQGSD
jgi:hypothetical protein